MNHLTFYRILFVRLLFLSLFLNKNVNTEKLAAWIKAIQIIYKWCCRNLKFLSWNWSFRSLLCTSASWIPLKISPSVLYCAMQPHYSDCGFCIPCLFISPDCSYPNRLLHTPTGDPIWPDIFLLFDSIKNSIHMFSAPSLSL